MPEVRDQLIKLGVDPAGSTPQELQQRIKTDDPIWRERVKEANVSLE